MVASLSSESMPLFTVDSCKIERAPKLMNLNITIIVISSERYLRLAWIKLNFYFYFFNQFWLNVYILTEF